MTDFYKSYYDKYWRHRIQEDKLYKKAPTRVSIALDYISLNPELEILDIGAGEGTFARAALEKAEYTIDGIEVSKEAGNVSKKYYHKLWIGDITDEKFVQTIKKKYDVIVCLEVIEHLIDPKALIKAAKSLLKPSGLFLVSTPNIAWWKYRLDLLRGRFIDESSCFSDLDHLHYFTIDSLNQLLQEEDFLIESNDGASVFPSYLGRLPDNLQRNLGKMRPNLMVYQMVTAARKRSEKPLIAHYAEDYLNKSEPWLYNQIQSQEQFDSIVLTRNLRNRKYFPHDRIYKYPLLFEMVSKNSSLKKPLALGQRLIDRFTDREVQFYSEVVSKTKPKLIHAHYGPTGWKALPVAKKFSLPLVVSFYGVDVNWLPHNKREWQEKYQELFKKLDAAIVRGPTMQRKLENLGCPSKKIYYIDYGIDVSSINFHPPKKSKTVELFMASRLVPFKGVDYVLRAMKIVEQKQKNINLTIIGDGPEKKKLKKLAHELRLKRVTFKDFMPQKELIDHVYNYHIFLHPSIEINDTAEGNPTSLLERIAAGFPVIATRHGDIPLEVKDGKNGYLVPEKNVDALVKAIVKLSNQPEKWEAFGRFGRKIVEKDFDLTKQTSKRESLYKDLIVEYDVR